MLDQTNTSAQSGPAQAPRPQSTSHLPPSQQPSVTESADQALQSVSLLYNTVDGVLQRQLQENPYLTLAAAAGVGFVLGGGLRSGVGQLLMRLSVRAFGPPLVNAALQGALERANHLGISGMAPIDQTSR
ncbi:MAG: hypothetical protein ABW321_13675 [Polyangiales bacterium]